MIQDILAGIVGALCAVVIVVFCVAVIYANVQTKNKDHGKQGNKPHTMKLWADLDTGMGDGRHGWRCSCGEWGMGNSPTRCPHHGTNY